MRLRGAGGRGRAARCWGPDGAWWRCGGLGLIARIGAVGGCCVCARPMRPGPGQARSEIWRVVEPAAGGARRAGAQGRRHLPGRQALYHRRPHLRAPGKRQLQRRGPGILVRRGFPRPGDRQRRSLRHDVDLGRASDAADPELCARHQPRQPKSIIVRVNDRGPYHANRADRCFGAHRQAARLLRQRRRRGCGSTTSAAPRSKAPTTPSSRPRLRSGTPAPGPAEVRIASSRPFLPQSARLPRRAAPCRCRPTGRSNSATTRPPRVAKRAANEVATAPPAVERAIERRPKRRRSAAKPRGRRRTSFACAFRAGAQPAGRHPAPARRYRLCAGRPGPAMAPS